MGDVAASEAGVSTGTASPYSPARRRGTAEANREQISSAGPGAGGAPGAGGDDASLEQRSEQRAQDADDYGDALKRPLGGAGALDGTNYQGGIH
jgi:hypothetical protein